MVEKTKILQSIDSLSLKNTGSLSHESIALRHYLQEEESTINKNSKNTLKILQKGQQGVNKHNSFNNEPKIKLPWTRWKRNGQNPPIVLLSFGTSETAFIADHFNNVRACVYVSDPLAIWEAATTSRNAYDIRQVKTDPINNNAFITEKINELVHESTGDFLREIIECKYSSKIENVMYNIVKYAPWHIKTSNFLRQSLYCSVSNTKCQYKRNAVEQLNQICKEKGRNIAIKLREERIPKNLQYVLENLSNLTNTKPYIIHLVRDPRAVFWSMAKHGRLPMNPYQSAFQDHVAEFCEKMEKDLLYGKEKLPDRYLLLKYETHGNKTDKILFEHIMERELLPSNLYTQRNVSDRLDMEWVEELDLNWWRKEIDPDFSQQVEERCWFIMDFLGYKQVGYEVELIRNINHSLIN